MYYYTRIIIKKGICSLIIMLLYCTIFGQINGVVYEKNTNNTINGAEIFESLYNTKLVQIGMTNIDGSFSLPFEFLNREIIIKKVNYNTKKVILVNNIKVDLEQDNYNLRITESDNNNPLPFLTKYFDKEGNIRENSFGNGFYTYYKKNNRHIFTVYHDENGMPYNKTECISGDCVHGWFSKYTGASSMFNSGFLFNGYVIFGRAVGIVDIYKDNNFNSSITYKPPFFEDLRITNIFSHYISFSDLLKKNLIAKYKSKVCGCQVGNCFSGIGTYVDMDRIYQNATFKEGQITDYGNIIYDNFNLNQKTLTNDNDPILNDESLAKISQNLILYAKTKEVASTVNKQIALSICPNTAKDGVWSILSYDDKGTYLIMDLKNQWTGAACMACPWETYYTKEKVYINKSNYEIFKIENYYKSDNVSQVWSTSDVMAGFAALTFGAMMLNTDDDDNKNSSPPAIPSSGSSSYPSSYNSGNSSSRTNSGNSYSTSSCTFGDLKQLTSCSSSSFVCFDFPIYCSGRNVYTAGLYVDLKSDNNYTMTAHTGGNNSFAKYGTNFYNPRSGHQFMTSSGVDKSYNNVDNLEEAITNYLDWCLKIYNQNRN